MKPFINPHSYMEEPICENKVRSRNTKSPSHYLGLVSQIVRKYVSCLVPRSSSVFVYGAWFGEKYADNTKYFFEYMCLTHPEITSVWITKSQEVVDEVTKKGFKAYLESSTEGRRYMQRAKYIFVCTGWRDIDDSYIGGAIVINFWHGVPLKKVMYDDQVFNPLNIRGKFMYYLDRYPHRNEFVISTSETLSKIYLHAFKRNKRHIVIAGQPRNDIFYSGFTGILRERFLNMRIITYMPTHRKQGKVVFDCDKLLDLVKINDLCKKYNCIFIIKKHFYHSNEEIISGHSNIVELTHENIDSQDLMLSSDVLITDYSSAYIDYLLLNRPILFYNFDMDDYLKTDRGMYFEYDQVTPGPVVKNFDDLYNELYNIIANNSDDYSELRSRVTDLFYDKIARQKVSPIVFQMIKNGVFE